MKSAVISRWSRPAVKRWVPTALLVAASLVLPSLCANAADDNAKTILKAMTDYVAGQKTISVAIDTDIEVITSDLQKIQFTSSGQLLLSRPDKLRASRIGGYADVELVFDGKTVTLHGKHLNAYAQVESPGSTDQLFGRLRGEFGFEAPGADLLLTGAYDALMQDVVLAQYIGREVIDGVECEHLAFRNVDTDWQLWVEMGSRPIPRKYVITNKSVTGGPQYTLRIKEWKTDPKIEANTFAFTAPAGSKKLEITALSGIDEVPSGMAR